MQTQKIKRPVLKIKLKNGLVTKECDSVFKIQILEKVPFFQQMIK